MSNKDCKPIDVDITGKAKLKITHGEDLLTDTCIREDLGFKIYRLVLNPHDSIVRFSIGSTRVEIRAYPNRGMSASCEFERRLIEANTLIEEMLDDDVIYDRWRALCREKEEKTQPA